MEWQAKSDIMTKQTSERTSQIDIALDFQTIGLLNPDRLYSEISAGRNAIREEIFRVVAEQVVPGMVAATGMRLEQPERAGVREHIDTDWSLGAGRSDDGRLLTQHLMNLHIAAESDQPMNAATMLQIGRGTVAAAVADVFAHSLEQHYLGKMESEDYSESSTSGEKVTAYRPGRTEE